jgi:hypothetical protein
MPEQAQPATGEASRRYVHPQDGETLRDIAARVLPDLPPGKGAEQLLVWNLHLTNRLNKAGAAARVLTSDIVFVEPLARS